MTERHLPTTSSAERAAVLARSISASVSGDSTVIAELFTDDVQGWSPALQVSSAAELAGEFEDREDAFSEIELEMVALDVGADQACVEWQLSVTHTGPLRFDDVAVIEPTGRRVTLRGATIAEFDGVKICAFRQYWDELGVFEQLGLLQG